MDVETFGLFRAAIRRFVDERLIPAEDTVEEADAVPDAIVDEMREMGLFGISVPEAYGGLGCTMSEEAALIRELTRASVVFRSVIGTTLGIGSQGIVIDGTEAQKREWLPKFASGAAIASFCLTEPEAAPMPPRSAPSPCATATRIASPAPSASSLTRRARTSSR